MGKFDVPVCCTVAHLVGLLESGLEQSGKRLYTWNFFVMKFAQSKEICT